MLQTLHGRALQGRAELLAATDARGRTPLHLAVANPRASSAVVHVLLASHRDAVCVRDHTGRTPVHACAEACVHPTVMELLLAAHPDGTLDKCEVRACPAHCWCMYVCVCQ